MAAILAAGVGIGFAGDFLLRAPGGPGLNFTLLFVGLAASVVIVSRSGGPRLGREASLWVALGVLFGAGLVWRGSELLRFLAFVAACTAFALPALHAGRPWVRRARVPDLLEAVTAAGLHAGLGSLRLFQKGRWETVGSEESRGTARVVIRSATVGVLLAAVPLLVFGALFFSADPVFSTIVEDFVRIDLRTLASHLTVAAILSWLACGYLTGLSSGTRLDGLRGIGWARPSLGVAEVAVALGLVDLLFLGFVTVQFRYLFGGAEWVEVTPGLSYAAYARQGFFQLVAATALGLPWLLVADGLLRERSASARWIFRTLAGAQLVLLLVIVASAVQRMRAYLDAYGLTESRFVATGVLGWLALLVLWFGATMLRGRRTPFAFGTLVSAFALVALLQVADPAARSVRSQLERAEVASLVDTGSGSRLDVEYLTTLGSDATPILVARLDELDEAGRCEVARRLLSRWGPEREDDWRSWNLADRRARQRVRADAARLRAMAGNGEDCG
jgi:hypothetical protein